MKINRSQAAFTLIEIMVVVVIIGILTTLVVVKLGNHTTEAKITATKANIETIRVGIGKYEMENGKYPPSIAELVKGPKYYLDRESVPLDGWNNEFKYYLKGDLVKVRSAGKDATFDTEDDIENP